jgi:hypothetical protein
VSSNQAGTTRPPINAHRLWSGGVAAVAVAVLAALVGILFVRGVLGVPVLAPKRSGAFGGSPTGRYALLAAIATLAATGTMHLLLRNAPYPMRYFNWIMGLAGLAAFLLPFSSGRPTREEFGTALINAAIGLVIWSLVGSAGRAAAPPSAPPGPPPALQPPAPRPAPVPQPDTEPGHPW